MGPRDYAVIVGPLTEAEGGGYGATVPELPGCMSDGGTPQEALENVYDDEQVAMCPAHGCGLRGKPHPLIGCWIEAAQEMGREVPAPKHMKAA